MSFSKRVATGLMAGFLLSVPWVRAQTSAPNDRPRSISRTSLVGSDAMGSPCKGANGAANRAFDGVTLEDFAPAALTRLTRCELRILETQLGMGEGAEAILSSTRSGRAQIVSADRRR
jgi:hypothetical protein